MKKLDFQVGISTLNVGILLHSIFEVSTYEIDRIGKRPGHYTETRAR